MPEEEEKETKKEDEPSILADVGEAESFSFKAETSELLQIVAKSLYTDPDVFIRELISNASDALEKQRFLELQGEANSIGEPLQIAISTNTAENTFQMIDTGVGMSKETLVNEIGTIARSGTKKFIESIKDKNTSAEGLIGQFGVGFYSTFIVSNHVEVITTEGTGEA